MSAGWWTGLCLVVFGPAAPFLSGPDAHPLTSGICVSQCLLSSEGAVAGATLKVGTDHIML